eukprot:scaffold138089_cov28-Tisochrysis_lutea.AAC.3
MEYGVRGAQRGEEGKKGGVGGELGMPEGPFIGRVQSKEERRQYTFLVGMIGRGSQIGWKCDVLIRRCVGSGNW